ncbi:MAG TPA: TAXI family TRAP transporter solute-binding subunit [Bradyrhizobium sp.]|nr:TAXI family TRAP transporter solute-binding subunit [Bradyrhizobium sp.]
MSDLLNGMRDLPLRGRRRKGSPFLIVAAALALFAAAAGAAFLILRPTTLRIAVGPVGSDDHGIVQAMSQTFAREGLSVRLALVPTAGPVDSLAALSADKADLAVARADEQMPDGATAVAVLRKNVAVLWAAPRPKTSGKGGKTGIKGIADLAGKRVGVVGRTEVNLKLLRVILTASGVSTDKVSIVQFNVGQIGEMVRDATLDAFMTVAPVDSKLTAEAIATTAKLRGEPSFLPIEVSEAIASRNPAYESEEIPESAFSTSPARPDDKVETVSISHLIIAPSSLSETTVGTLTRQIFAARPALIRETPVAARIEKPNTDKDAALPAHPGAAAYIDGTERTFMEKYSDYIWGAVLLLSVFGSATAWLRHYVKRDERRLNTVHREKLLLAIGLLRQIETMEDLDTLQREADDILRETLTCYDDGAIEEGDLLAYSLVLDQFHNAIVDRRAAIATGTNPARLRA